MKLELQNQNLQITNRRIQPTLFHFTVSFRFYFDCKLAVEAVKSCHTLDFKSKPFGGVAGGVRGEAVVRASVNYLRIEYLQCLSSVTYPTEKHPTAAMIT